MIMRWKLKYSIYSFQCDRKEHFIERIKEMDFEVQTQLVPYIQEVFFTMFSGLLDKYVNQRRIICRVFWHIFNGSYCHYAVMAF